MQNETHHLATLARPPEAPTRTVHLRTEGSGHGGITRLVSPGDIGELIKPFIFVDRFQLDSRHGKMPMHPHSGIATVTAILDGTFAYRESTGAHGELTTGGVEFMSAGGGVWHQGMAADGAKVLGFQLWLALPPEDENAPARSQYLAPADVPHAGPARVLLGRYGDAVSPIQPRASLTYLHVVLADGERWRYLPPSGHTVAWVGIASGVLHTGKAALSLEVAVFAEGEQAIEFVAEGRTEFVLGSAVKHPHALISGDYSVHTSAAALRQGEREIVRLHSAMRDAAAA
ncbi:pirin family protein [Massilia sp. S19_KUP03_FR1]|uniref:pirin family protein n=1 Tax=Massilia sp. S19_KUP03_FR1 TaxID=3025503 RepID=UPI002FCDC452